MEPFHRIRVSQLTLCSPTVWQCHSQFNWETKPVVTVHCTAQQWHEQQQCSGRSSIRVTKVVAAQSQCTRQSWEPEVGTPSSLNQSHQHRHHHQHQYYHQHHQHHQHYWHISCNVEIDNSCPLFPIFIMWRSRYIVVKTPHQLVIMKSRIWKIQGRWSIRVTIMPVLHILHNIQNHLFTIIISISIITITGNCNKQQVWGYWWNWWNQEGSVRI